MPSEITVVVSDSAQTAAIRGGLALSGRVMWFSEGNLATALDSIRMNHPKLIAVEAAFAQRPQGQVFLSKIEQMAIRGSAIQLVVRANAGWAMTPYSAGEMATTQSPTVSAAVRSVVPVAVAEGAAAAPQTKGTNTRRASRFKVLESLNAVVENGQANLVNISIIGAQVVSPSVIRPTQKVKIMLPDAKNMVELNGQVAWSTFERIQLQTEPYYRAGMEFTDAAQEILEDYCRRHCSHDPLPSY
jgi:PilZ domain-containing protein